MDVAIDMNNLASLLEDTGRLTEAGRMYEQSHAIRRALMRPTHPSVATLLHNDGRLLVHPNGSVWYAGHYANPTIGEFEDRDLAAIDKEEERDVPTRDMQQLRQADLRRVRSPCGAGARRRAARGSLPLP